MKDVVEGPLVSVVIINWNYGRFVAEAIQSVKDQTYRNFRCIVVDNGSDDDSVARIIEAIADDPQFTFHRLPSNLGHLGGAIWSLAHVTGEFVAFLDADDVLSPTYLASHLQAHLSAGFAVGFTSSNCVDVNANGDLLTGGCYSMYHFWQEAVPALRPPERAMRLNVVDEQAYRALSEAARYVPPHKPGWQWCPGSSNMFRRALLDRIRPAEAGPALFGGVDGFFTPILHALTGTVLIDQPLSAYRVHGANDFSTLPSIAYVHSANPRAEMQAFGTFVRVVVWLIVCIDDLLTMVPASRYWQIVEGVKRAASPESDAFSHPEVKAALARQYPRLVELFGEFRLCRELRRHMRFPVYLSIVVAARNRILPLTDIGRAMSWEFLRTARWVSVLAVRRLSRRGA